MSRKLLLSVGTVLLSILLVLLTGEVALVSIVRYFTSLQAPPQVITDNRFAHPFLLFHVAGGVTALLIAPLQLIPRIRERRPAIHRAIGRTYALACAAAAPAGFMLALGTQAGPIAGTGFSISAVLWAGVTFLGVKAAIEGRIDDHRAWMIRSYAITSNAITLRLMLPFAALVLGLPFVPAYQVIAWLSWLTNLAVAELYIRRRQQGSQVQAELATA